MPSCSATDVDLKCVVRHVTQHLAGLSNLQFILLFGEVFKVCFL